MNGIIVCPMTPKIGAKIEEVNLREDLSDQVVEESRDAWPKHQVIFFATRNFPRTTHSFRRPLR